MIGILCWLFHYWLFRFEFYSLHLLHQRFHIHESVQALEPIHDAVKACLVVNLHEFSLLEVTLDRTSLLKDVGWLFWVRLRSYELWKFLQIGTPLQGQCLLLSAGGGLANNCSTGLLLHCSPKELHVCSIWSWLAGVTASPIFFLLVALLRGGTRCTAWRHVAPFQILVLNLALLLVVERWTVFDGRWWRGFIGSCPRRSLFCVLPIWPFDWFVQRLAGIATLTSFFLLFPLPIWGIWVAPRLWIGRWSVFLFLPVAVKIVDELIEVLGYGLFGYWSVEVITIKFLLNPGEEIR